ncbi:sensor histidine kinase [Streptomyces coriariae]|uniref:sensor histidine kinase n=1 Tax=Streptomyces coriariae TaxID=2864460 RepID=UPI001E64CE7E|nr:ATP-binding protein [Streptomyces coriariae]
MPVPPSASALGAAASPASATPASAAPARASGAEESRSLDELYQAALAEGGGSSSTPAATRQGALRLLCARAKAEGAAARVRFLSAGERRPVLDGPTAATLFRVAQSTLANVREHARAVNVLVTLHGYADRTELEVRDDGAGFETGRVGVPARAVRGLGIPAARARLRECGGDLVVGSVPGRGTCVRATVPALAKSRPAAQVAAR